MSEGERPNQPQRYCSNCGAEIRSDTRFCVSCGKQIAGNEERIEANTRPTISAPNPRGSDLSGQDNVRLVLFGVGALLFLVVAYLLLSYSVPLGFLLIVLMALVVLIIRKHRGSQTVPERRLFEAVGWYGQSARRAYEEGRHRELAQSAYQQSRRAYEGANTRYQEWSEKQAAERERQARERERLAQMERERRARPYNDHYTIGEYEDIQRNWGAVRNDQGGKNPRRAPSPRPDRPRGTGPAGWELGEIERELDRLYDKKRRNKVWLGVYGLIVVVPMLVLGPYAFLAIIIGLLFLPLFWFEESSSSERIAYLERRKAYLEGMSR